MIALTILAAVLVFTVALLVPPLVRDWLHDSQHYDGEPDA